MVCFWSWIKKIPGYLARFSYLLPRSIQRYLTARGFCASCIMHSLFITAGNSMNCHFFSSAWRMAPLLSCSLLPVTGVFAWAIPGVIHSIKCQGGLKYWKKGKLRGLYQIRKDTFDWAAFQCCKTITILSLGMFINGQLFDLQWWTCVTASKQKSVEVNDIYCLTH